MQVRLEKIQFTFTNEISTCEDNTQMAYNSDLSVA